MSAVPDELKAGERVSDLTDWTHATVRPPGVYTHTPARAQAPPLVSLLYDDGRERDFIPVNRLAR
jgi:hypothetical protein